MENTMSDLFDGEPVTIPIADLPASTDIPRPLSDRPLGRQLIAEEVDPPR